MNGEDFINLRRKTTFEGEGTAWPKAKRWEDVWQVVEC